MSQSVPRVRIAPSPTGDPHIGTAYQALFDFAFARQQCGTFLLRIEDTDQARYNPESEQRIYAALRWLGLNWDEGPDVGGSTGPYRQSERLPLYAEYARQLVEHGQAYYCFCTRERLEQVRKDREARKLPPKYDRHCLFLAPEEVRARLLAGEPWVIRLRMPDAGETTFNDVVRGPIAFRNDLQDDQVLIKSDGFPTYHLAVVVDDHLMGITHVVRGEEWIPSTPKHVVLYHAFGWEMPLFIHMPLMRNADKSKISKRKNHTSIEWYRNQGFLPAALLNYLALQGWSMPDGRETFSLDGFIAAFTWDRVSVGGPIFDIKRLDDLNGQYIRMLSEDDLIAALSPWIPDGVERARLRPIIPLIQTRINRLSEFDRQAAFFFTEPNFVEAILTPHRAEFDAAYRLVQLADPSLPPLERRAPPPAGVLGALLAVTGRDEDAAPSLEAALAALGAVPSRAAAAALRKGQLTLQTIEPREKNRLDSQALALAAIAATVLQDQERGADLALRALLIEPRLGPERSYALLGRAEATLRQLEAWNTQILDNAVRTLAEEQGVKVRQLAEVVRVAITGRKEGPPLFESMEILGAQRSLARIDRALARL